MRWFIVEGNWLVKGVNICEELTFWWGQPHNWIVDLLQRDRWSWWCLIEIEGCFWIWERRVWFHFSGDDWDQGCSWLKLTITMFMQISVFVDFFKLFNHLRFVVDIKKGHKFCKMWNNTDLLRLWDNLWVGQHVWILPIYPLTVSN